MSWGHAQTVLLPVLGACSISSYTRGLPWLWPLDSTGMAHVTFRWDGTVSTGAGDVRLIVPCPDRPCNGCAGNTNHFTGVGA